MGKPIMKTLGEFISKHNPEILTGMGIAGMISTTVLAVKTTPKAVQMIQDEEERLNDKLTKVEVVRLVGPLYIPAVVTCTLSAASLICANGINNKRNAALATAYSLSERALMDYREKVVEVVGEEKEKEIRQRAAKESPVKDVIFTSKGGTLCYIPVSGARFECDIDRIRRAENIINKQLLDDMYASLNDFYDEVGIPCTEMGNTVGWNIDDGLIQLYFSAELNEEDKPYLVVNFSTNPKPNYQYLM